jgi:DNA-3-methyladenine glycosylase II
MKGGLVLSKTITLNSQSDSVQYLCKKDKRLAKLIEMVGSITYTVHDDPYEFLIHEIIEQMLSKKAGNKIFSRLVTLCNGKVTPHAISNLTDEEIKSIGTANSKVTFIRSVTNAVLSNELNFESLESMSDEDVFSTLTSIKGIGKWTANMYLIFVLNRPNILPTSDAAFQQTFEWLYKMERSEANIRAKCKKWSPYSSTASRYLYRALDLGLTKNEFHLKK